MRRWRWCLSLLFVLAIVPAVQAADEAKPAADDEAGFKEIFDGKTLTGWDGNPEFWSVADGCIVAQTTKEKPTKGNTFLIWRQGEVDDFELRLSYRMVGGNSGVQYRSKEVDKWVISGPQADFESGDKFSGIHYEEKGRGIMALRGRTRDRGQGRQENPR